LAYNGIKLKLYFETLKTLEFMGADGKVEETQLSSQNDLQLILDQVDANQLSEEWVMVDEREVGDNELELDNHLVEAETSLEPKTSFLSKVIHLVQTGNPLPKLKSTQDKNVKDLKSFWIDLDCGESKAVVNPKTGRPDGYIDQPTALQELQKFCKLIGLPKPLLVNSGRGIHAYWPLTNPVSREEWEPVANRLNELCVLHNLYVDASVFEIARVLRVPGTLNFKDNPPKPVELISDAPDVEYETFKNLLGVKEAPTKPSAPKELSELQKAMAANT